MQVIQAGLEVHPASSAMGTEFLSRIKTVGASSPTSLAESRVLMPRVSFSSARLKRSGVTEEMDVEELILLVKDHDVIYDAWRC